MLLRRVRGRLIQGGGSGGGIVAWCRPTGTHGGAPPPLHDTQGCPRLMPLYASDRCSLCSCLFPLHLFRVHSIQFRQCKLGARVS